MVGLLKPGDVLIVAKLDRAFRSAADALNRADAWKKQGVRLIVADMGVEPVTDNGASKMFFGMLALVAEFERDRIRDRLSNGRHAKAAKGGHLGGEAPFGYRVEGLGKDARLIEVPEQQAALATIRELCGSMALRKIAEEVERVNRDLPEGTRINKYLLLHKELDPDDEEVTRTRKVRRGFVAKKYADIIEALYSEARSVGVTSVITYQDGRQATVRTELAIRQVGAARELAGV